METETVVPTLTFLCPHCNTMLHAEARDDVPLTVVFCPECGKRVKLVVEEEKVRERWGLVAEMEDSSLDQS